MDGSAVKDGILRIRHGFQCQIRIHIWENVFYRPIRIKIFLKHKDKTFRMNEWEIVLQIIVINADMESVEPLVINQSPIDPAGISQHPGYSRLPSVNSLHKRSSSIMVLSKYNISIQVFLYSTGIELCITLRLTLHPRWIKIRAQSVELLITAMCKGLFLEKGTSASSWAPFSRRISKTSGKQLSNKCYIISIIKRISNMLPLNGVMDGTESIPVLFF